MEDDGCTLGYDTGRGTLARSSTTCRAQLPRAAHACCQQAQGSPTAPKPTCAAARPQAALQRIAGGRRHQPVYVPASRREPAAAHAGRGALEQLSVLPEAHGRLARGAVVARDHELRHRGPVLAHQAAGVACAREGDEQLRGAVHGGRHGGHTGGLRQAKGLGRVVPEAAHTGGGERSRVHGARGVCAAWHARARLGDHDEWDATCSSRSTAHAEVCRARAACVTAALRSRRTG